MITAMKHLGSLGCSVWAWNICTVESSF